MKRFATAALVLILSGAVVSCSSDSRPEPVGATDSVVNQIPQVLELQIVATDSGHDLVNTGNVTMHDIEVTNGDDRACKAKELDPGDSKGCDEANESSTITAVGPNDQAYES